MLNFTQEELSFLANHFGYKHLEGFEFVEYDKNKCVASLLDKGYVFTRGKNIELSNECRLLLSSWERIRYTCVNRRCMTESHIHAILASSQRIISYSKHYEEIQVVMCDFSADVMDKIFVDYLSLDEYTDACPKFNVTFSAEEYISYFKNDLPNDAIAKSTGLSVDDISMVKEALTGKAHTSYIVQDVVKDVGCMGVIIKCSDGYVLIKHIVPNQNISNQKVVVTKGNSQDIVDSIYIL